jgi:hypothetical protein
MEYSLQGRNFKRMVEANLLRTRGSCPKCRENALVPILYGPLPDSLTPDRERGAFFWGGLVQKRDSPRWKCSRCHETFPAEAV